MFKLQLIRLLNLILQRSIHNEIFFSFFKSFLKVQWHMMFKKTTIIGIQQQAPREGLPVY